MRPSVKKLLLFGSTAPYSGAQLVLDFVGSRTSGQPYYMLGGVNYPSVSGVPGWAYTGGTAAGVGSYAARQDGSLQFFPSYTNLLLQSQTFNTSWTISGSTVTADQTTAPNGTLTAEKLDEQTNTGAHQLYQSVTVASGASYTISFYLKAAERTYAAIWDGGTSKGKFFNLSAGTVGGNLVGAPDNATITNAGNGWYRCTVTITTASTTLTPYIFLSTDGSTFNYTGTAGSGIYAWGAQLELGSTASTYIPTTTAAVTVGTPRITDAGYWAEEARTNLLTYSDQFDNAAWTKVEATVTANQSTAPDGTLTADLITTTVAGNPRVYQQLGISGNGSAYTGSVFVKAGTTTEANALLYVNSGTPASVTMTANILSGPGSITSAGVISGLSTTQWTRIGLTGTPSSASGNLALYIRPRLSGSTIGDTIYVWGAQLELGSFATSPIPTTSVAVTRAADVGYVSGLVVPSAYTLFASGIVPTADATTNRIISTLGVGTDTNNRASIIRFTTAAISPLIYSAGSGAGASGFGVTPGNLTRAAVAFASGSSSFSADGNTTTTGAATAPVGTIDRLTVGGRNDNANTFNAPIRRIVIYPRAFGNAELQAITTAGAY